MGNRAIDRVDHAGLVDWHSQVPKHFAPRLQGLLIHLDDPAQVWTQIPLTFRILNAGLWPRSVMDHRPQEGVRVVERRSREELHTPFPPRSIHVNAIPFLILNIKEGQLIDELPVPPEVSIRGSSHDPGLFIGEMRL